MTGLIVLLIIAFLIIAVLAFSLFKKKQQLEKYAAITDIEAEQNRILKETRSLSKDNEKLRKEVIADAEEERSQIQKESQALSKDNEKIRKEAIADAEKERSQIQKESQSLSLDNEKIRKKAIADAEKERNQIQMESHALLKDNQKLRKDGRLIREAVTSLKSQLTSLEDEQDMQKFGLYEPKYNFGTSTGYKAKLGEVRQQQKKLIKDKKAIIWGTEWQVSGSKAKGSTMMGRLTRLTLRAFNGECDSIIVNVKYNNVDRIKTRIEKVYEAINKLNASQDARINPEYLDLKVQELYVVYEYQEKLQAEKEEQRQIREQMREEQRAQKELAKAQRDAEKEEDRYQKALDKARSEMTKATGENQSKLEGEIERLSQMLEEANTNKERAISRAQMTKSGYVYIISNIGSFGENVYKIGMTRRLVPMDRVKELGDASVPFIFDVHALIYSENAPALENHLHKVFDSKRLNLVNSRKEFFRVSLDDIAEAVKERSSTVEFTMKADAEDYRKTQSIIAENNKASVVESSGGVYDDILGIE